MESSYIFVEIDSEEVQASSPSVDCSSIMSNYFVKVCSGFGSNWADLFVATGIAGNEKDRDAFYLL